MVVLSLRHKPAIRCGNVIVSGYEGPGFLLVIPDKRGEPEGSILWGAKTIPECHSLACLIIKEPAKYGVVL